MQLQKETHKNKTEFTDTGAKASAEARMNMRVPLCMDPFLGFTHGRDGTDEAKG